LKQATKLKEDAFGFGTSTGNTNGQANGNGNDSRKRPVAASDASQSTPQPQPKKSKTKNANDPGSQNLGQPQAVADASTASNGKAAAKVKVEVTDCGLTNIAKSKDINIPIDENCPLIGYTVYIDDDGLIYDASLNQTNASNNNNKFYRLQVIFPKMRAHLTRTYP
jgi:poly [ADP-ribose] polymerase